MKASQYIVHSTQYSSSNNLYGCFSTETKSHQKLSLFYDTAQYNNRQNVAIKMENKKISEENLVSPFKVLYFNLKNKV